MHQWLDWRYFWRGYGIAVVVFILLAAAGSFVLPAGRLHQNHVAKQTQVRQEQEEQKREQKASAESTAVVQKP